VALFTWVCGGTTLLFWGNTEFWIAPETSPSARERPYILDRDETPGEMSLASFIFSMKVVANLLQTRQNVIVDIVG
jgi:hypothetical protein